MRRTSTPNGARECGTAHAAPGRTANDADARTGVWREYDARSDQMRRCAAVVGLDPRDPGRGGHGAEGKRERRAVHGVNRRVGEKIWILREGGQNDARRLGSRLRIGVVMSVTVRTVAVPVMVMGVGVMAIRIGTGFVRQRRRRGGHRSGRFQEVEEVVDAMGRADDEKCQLSRGGEQCRAGSTACAGSGVHGRAQIQAPVTPRRSSCPPPGRERPRPHPPADSWCPGTARRRGSRSWRRDARCDRTGTRAAARRALRSR